MDWAPGPGARDFLAVERDGDRWVISADRTGNRLLSWVPRAVEHVGTADISDTFKTCRLKAPP